MDAPLDSRQLRAFAILAETGSFTETARRLNLTQSAISHSMKGLEEDVRCRLLDRDGKKVILTQTGEHLLVHAHQVLAMMQTARDELAQLGRWGHGRLRIGASTSACQHILPAVFREFKESFPHCTIHIEPGDTPHSIERLRNHSIDLALAVEAADEAPFEFRPLFTDELQFVVGPLHPWAASGHAVREEIGRQNYIVYRKSSYTVRMIEAYFLRENVALPSLIELGSIEAIKEMVKVGIGISVLAPWVARKELEERSLFAVTLGKRKLRRRWGILHAKGRRLTLPEETFIGLCQTVTTGPDFSPGRDR